MSKRKRLTGRERRELRRRQRQPLARRSSLVLWAVAAGVAIAIVAVVAVLVLRSGGGSSKAVANPTPAVGVTVAAGDQTPQSSTPPPVSGEPTVPATGLKFIDTTVGTGETPRAGQTVVVDYTGWLSDGTKFDSSVDRGTPFEFVLGAGQVIAGWDEGLGARKGGGQRRPVIPPGLG